MGFLVLSSLLSACSANHSGQQQPTKDASMSAIPATFEIKVLKQAPENAPLVQSGQLVTVHYTGWVLGKTKADAFDSSVKRGTPFSFRVSGKGAMAQVIRGWDEGVRQMPIGGTYEITMAPSYGYGERGAGGLIPPNATLVFEIEVLSAQ
jgi:FKBP-type peptidyl-prolyl cis-trans isomerase